MVRRGLHQQHPVSTRHARRRHCDASVRDTRPRWQRDALRVNVQVECRLRLDFATPGDEHERGLGYLRHDVHSGSVHVSCVAISGRAQYARYEVTTYSV